MNSQFFSLFTFLDPINHPLLETSPYDTALLPPPTCLAASFLAPSSTVYPWNSIIPVFLASPSLPPSLSVWLSFSLCMYKHTHKHRLSSSKILSIPTTSTVNSILRTSKCLWLNLTLWPTDQDFICSACLWKCKFSDLTLDLQNQLP